ncbi:DNA-binding transcriptional regulator [Rhizobacter sp. Root1221]|uniref:helix-turn-helix domain-containing protein n=1 Tax=Rhizobacter sp. Root1221 TaxID=1736433 RepID=UPI000B170179|nr:transcriptional regulator [Rhizobacter sp. Root1221]
MPRKKVNEDARLLQEALETAEDLFAYGVLSKPNLAKVRVLCEVPPDYSPEHVVKIRTKVAKMSQSVFATFLNVSVSTVQKWESPRAEKHPSGAAAKLLQIVEAKGVEALIA